MYQPIMYNEGRCTSTVESMKTHLNSMCDDIKVTVGT